MVNIEIWNGNYLSLQRMTDINLRKIELRNLKATYATLLTCKKVARAFGHIKYKTNLREEILFPLVDALVFIG